MSNKQDAIAELDDLSRCEGWLLSLEIFARSVRLVADFSSNDSSTDGEVQLKFEGVSGLKFRYDQNVFSSDDDDISSIDFMRVETRSDEGTAAYHMKLELSYGTLDFFFEDLEIG